MLEQLVAEKAVLLLMNNIAPSQFEHWISEVLSHLASCSYDLKLFSPINTVVKEIKLKNGIKKNLPENGELFIENFAANSIPVILNTESPTEQIDHNYSILLKSFASLVPYLISQDFPKFLDSATKIVTNTNSVFYSQSLSDVYNASSMFSPHYTECLKLIGSPLFLNNINAFFDQELSSNDIHHIHVIFIFLNVLARHFNKTKILDFLHKSLDKLTILCDCIDEKQEIRNIDEKEMNSIFSNFQLICLDPTSIREMENIQAKFNIKLIKSGLLNKQFAGIKSLRTMLLQRYANTSAICLLMYHESLIDYLLQNMHHELAIDFGFIFREMAKNGKVNGSHIKQFWILFVRQHPSTIDHFFEAWNNFIVAIPPSQSSSIVDIMLEVNEYPDEVLKLISTRHLKMNKDQARIIFNRLSDIYFSSNNSNQKSLLLSTLPSVISFIQSNEIKTEIQNNCLSLINSKQHIGYALFVLKEIFTNLSPEQSQIYLDEIINMAAIDATQYLELIARIIYNIHGFLSQEEFSKLETITEQILKTNCGKFAHFYTSLINNNKLTTQMMYQLYRNVVINLEEIIKMSDENRKANLKPEPLNYYSDSMNNVDLLMNFIQSLFCKINSGQIMYDKNGYKVSGIKMLSRCGGVTELWNLFFKTGDKSVSNYLISLYALNKEPGSYYQFIEKCSTRIESIGSLNALISLIHKVEDGVDHEFLNISPNIFISDDEYMNIFICGDIDSVMRIPKFISTENFFSRVSMIANVNREDISFENNSILMLSSDKLKNNMTIDVRIHSTSNFLESEEGIFQKPEPKPVQPSLLPSILILHSTFLSKIYDIMKKNDHDLSASALQLLSLIPNIPEEDQLFNNFDIDWDSFFAIESPFLFIYRANMVGNKIANHNPDWFDHFLTTNGATIFIERVLHCFNKDTFTIYNLNKLMKICRLITVQDCWDSLEPEIITHIIGSIEEGFEKKTEANFMNSLINKVVSSNDQDLDSLTLYFITKLAIFSYGGIIKYCTDFSSFVKKMLLNKNYEIRESTKELISNIPPKEQKSILIDILQNSNMYENKSSMDSKTGSNSYCTEFFEVLINSSRDFDNVQDFLEQLLSIFYHKYEFPNKSQNPIEKLEFDPPPPDFTNGIISALNELISRVSLQLYDYKKLFSFIIENFLFNKFKYYQISSDCISLLENLIKKDNSLEQLLISHFCNIVHFMDNQQEFNNSNYMNTVQLSPSIQKRGLRNLGATCYINSTLQQFFYIPEIRTIILSANLKNLSNSNSDNADNNLKLKNNELCNNVKNEDLWAINLQKVFAHLLFFPAVYIDPSCFINVWRSWDGEIINPHEQQDAVEFLQMLIDRLESKIPDAAEFFKGEISYNLLNSQHNFSSETVESFITFPLEVKDHLSVNDSLNTFLAPDRFDDYNVEDIGKISVERYAHVRKAPKILIIQLKRFEYNLQTNVREKVNDKYIFYSVLDITSVMEDKSVSMVYDLIGVIAHMGSAQGGHYISHILSGTGTWMTFNDENVIPITESKLVNSTFGGYNIKDMWIESTQRFTTTKVPKNGNAYLLFYRKRESTSSQDSSNRAMISNPMNTYTMNNLLLSIQNALFYNLLINNSFAKFIMSINFTKSSHIFIYKYFLICLRKIKDFALLSSAHEKCNQIVLSDSELANQIVDEYFDQFYEFCLLNNDKFIRQLYLSLVESSLKIANDRSKNAFMDSCLRNILNKGDTIMMYWNNFDEYFHPFLILMEFQTINTETWVPIFFNFLLTSVIEYAEKNNKINLSNSTQENNSLRLNEVLRSINLTAIFMVMKKIIVKHNLFDGFISQVLDSTFLMSFIQSKNQSKAFIEFVQSFCDYANKNTNSNLHRNKVIENLMKYNDFSPDIYAGFFVIFLKFASNAEYIIKNIESKNTQFIESFIKEVNVRLFDFKGSFSDSVFYFMKPLIASCLTSQDKNLRLTIVNFLEVVKIGYYQTFTLLINNLDVIVKTVEEISSNIINNKVFVKLSDSFIPTKEYFEVLEKCATKGNLQKAIVQYGKQIIDAIKSFGKFPLVPNMPKVHALAFLCHTINSEYTDQFFKLDNISYLSESQSMFQTFLNSYVFLDPTYSFDLFKGFLSLIPFPNNDTFFMHQIFNHFVKNAFEDASVGSLFKDFILQRMHPENYHIIISSLWNYELFVHNYLKESIFYFKLGSSILNRFPASSALFFQQNLFEFSSRKVIEHSFLNRESRRSIITPFLAKLLASFNESYYHENKGKSSFFNGNFVDKLVKKYSSMHLKIYEIYAISKRDPTGSYCIFLKSFTKLAPQACIQVFNYINSEQNGYIRNMSKTSQKHASILIAFICKKILHNKEKNSSMVQNLILREIEYIQTIDAIDPFCSILLEIKQNINLPTLENTFMHIMNKFTNPQLFTGLIRLILIDISERIFKNKQHEEQSNYLNDDTLFLNIVLNNASQTLKNQFSEQNDRFNYNVSTLLSFLLYFKNNFSISPPPINISEKEKESLSYIIVDNNTKADEALSLIYN